MSDAYSKSTRLLYIYTHLTDGETLNKATLSEQFGVSAKSIQRDMDMLRCFFAEEGSQRELVYDAKANGYKLVDRGPVFLSNNEILAVCKILLASRSMVKSEMEPILDKLVDCCVPIENSRAVKELIANEKYHYVEPHHQSAVLPLLWEIGLAIKKQLMIDIGYLRLKDHSIVTRRIRPVGLMFSEYYFYLVGYIDGINKAERFDNPDDDYPTIYRVDRIQEIRTTDIHFAVPYRDRFEEGEFRKRVQFMYGGKLQTVRFTYSGPSIEAVLDRLPTAKVVDERDSVYTVQAEVFGKGIDTWLRSQGEYVRSLSPYKVEESI